MHTAFQNIGLLACLVFPALLLMGFIAQRVVRNLREELDMAKYILDRGPVEEMPQLPPEEERLPGYQTLTQKDYDEIYRQLRERMNEANG